MGWAYAGLYGPEVILGSNSLEVTNLAVTVYEADGKTVASLWTDETMATAAANPATTDSLGNLEFYAVPGLYVLSFSLSGVATTRNVLVRPWYEEPAWGPGRIEDFGGSAAPAGFLLCNGAAVSRTTYADLFNAIGTAWGAGDGSTTFNLPDLRGRSTIGQGSLNTNAQPTIALAGTGGEAAHTLVATEMPAHAHSDAGHAHGISDPSHSHTMGGAPTDQLIVYASSSTIGLTGTSKAMGASGPGNINAASTGVSVQTASAQIQNTGGGGSHNNLHPYAGVTKIVRI